MEAVRRAGAQLDVDDAGPVLRGQVPAQVVAVLRANRDRVGAVLKLRAVHRCLGFSEEDVAFIEAALLAGRIERVNVVAFAPQAAPA
jgi:hypothetical protein